MDNDIVGWTSTLSDRLDVLCLDPRPLPRVKRFARPRPATLRCRALLCPFDRVNLLGWSEKHGG